MYYNKISKFININYISSVKNIIYFVIVLVLERLSNISINIDAMKNKHKNLDLFSKDIDFFEHLWDKSWTYIKTVVDVVREPVLILDRDFKVLAANEPFYKTFEVKPIDTENKIVYELGDGQWNIPDLRELLEGILPKDSFFKGFKVEQDFPFIGHKIMILNARQIYFEEEALDKKYGPLKLFKHIILLAIEDITEMMGIAETLASQTKEYEDKFMKRTKKMERNIEKLRKEIEGLKNNQLV